MPWAATPPTPVAYLDILVSSYLSRHFPSLPHSWAGGWGPQPWGPVTSRGCPPRFSHWLAPPGACPPRALCITSCGTRSPFAVDTSCLRNVPLAPCPCVLSWASPRDARRAPSNAPPAVGMRHVCGGWRVWRRVLLAPTVRAWLPTSSGERGGAAAACCMAGSCRRREASAGDRLPRG